MRHHSQVVRQRPAKPSPPVQIWVVPPFATSQKLICPSGGMADAKDLKSFGGNSVPVRVRPWVTQRDIIQLLKRVNYRFTN